MAGTDRSKGLVSGGPTVILSHPQLGQNIGMVARAMLNCGLGDLRLVAPRDGWPSTEALAASSGAETILERASLFETTEDAVADLDLLYALTARVRDMNKTVATPREAAAEMRAELPAGARVGLLFGPERSGLVNDEIALADRVVAIPLNPAFSSLNLAQAVLLVGYEWWMAGAAAPRPKGGANVRASKAELMNFFRRLETALDRAGFLRPPEMRPTMVRNIRSLFTRAGLSEREVSTLHGILSALARGDSDRNGR